ncbi:MAG: hypothetical protein QOE33_3316 [Acidobacteriota bacterium]|nr:hypothetical protein [Acidobacteriota bacterium]
MSGLIERVEFALRNPSGSLWLPEFTIEMVEAGWRDLYHKASLSPDAYGTARVMARDAGAPRNISSRLTMISGADGPEKVLLVETLDAEFVHTYNEADVRFYTADEIDATNVLAQLGEAITVLRTIPALFTTVAALVRCIHLLDSGDDDYDVSFSEPQIPFSIFVSVPRESSAISVLRVAEAIVHEAMHLQLTLIERIVPLVRAKSQRHYSPWREEFRNAQAVLHGLYVFCVIDEFFRALPAFPLREAHAASYLKRRRSGIHEQVGRIRSFQDSKDLTEIGSEFIRRMITGLEQQEGR